MSDGPDTHGLPAAIRRIHERVRDAVTGCARCAGTYRTPFGAEVSSLC